MSILGWIVIGGLAGWIASLLTGTDKSMGLIANIVVGIIGALIGGFVVRLLGADDGVNDFSIWSLFVAVIGSVLLLWVVKMFWHKA